MKKKFAISQDAIITMLGVIICLFSLIVICSQKSFLSFLQTGILAAFGFIGFWILIPAIFIFGIYLILRQKLMKFRFDITIWGIYLIILALLVITSMLGSEGQIVNLNETEYVLSAYKSGVIDDIEYKYIEFNNSVNIFKQLSANGLEITKVELGGGFLGFILCGALNSAFTPIGTSIIAWLMVAIGICMLLHRYIKKLFNFLKSKKERKAAHEDIHGISNGNDSYSDIGYENNDEVNNDTYSHSEPVQPTPVQMSAQADLFMRNLNNNHGLARPVFSLDDDQNMSPSAPESLSNSYFDEPTPSVQTPNASQPSLEEEKPNNNFAPSFLEEDESNDSFNDSFDSFSPNEEPSLENSYEEPQIAPQPAPVINQPVQPEPVQKPVVAEPVVDFLHQPQPKAVDKPPFILPPMDLLDFHENLDDLTKNNESCESRVNLLNQIFADMRVGATVVGYTIGPSVTRFDVQTRDSVSVNAIKRIVEDISVRLGGVPVRFEPVVIGKPTSGLEVENQIRTTVGLRESIESLPKEDKYLSAIPFGKDITGKLVFANLKEFPHLLVGGTTGSGKSIFMHSCITSLIMRNNPDQLKLLLIDPKKVEMNYYEGIPHLLCPNISEPKKALVAMRKLVDEMERRYNLFQANRVRDIKEFNRFAKDNGIQPLPLIAVFVDEFADLKDECKEIREPVVRIAQKARSAGIHLIIATQRPSVDVIDGVIKANLPTHVALMVANFTDSSTILGEGGAEKLLGNGDMIVDCTSISRTSKPRVQGCFVDTPELNRVTDYLREHYMPQYDPNFLDLEDHSNDAKGSSNEPEIVVDTAALKEASEEQLYEQIKRDVVTKEYCSISFIQRTYGVGFPKAGRMFAKLKKDGYVGEGGDARGSKVLIHAPVDNINSPLSIDESTLYEDKEDDSSQSEDVSQGDGDAYQGD